MTTSTLESHLSCIEMHSVLPIKHRVSKQTLSSRKCMFWRIFIGSLWCLGVVFLLGGVCWSRQIGILSEIAAITLDVSVAEEMWEVLEKIPDNTLDVGILPTPNIWLSLNAPVLICTCPRVSGELADNVRHSPHTHQSAKHFYTSSYNPPFSYRTPNPSYQKKSFQHGLWFEVLQSTMLMTIHVQLLYTLGVAWLSQNIIWAFITYTWYIYSILSHGECYGC